MTVKLGRIPNQPTTRTMGCHQVTQCNSTCMRPGSTLSEYDRRRDAREKMDRGK
jgi:hypothetical protein